MLPETKFFHTESTAKDEATQRTNDHIDSGAERATWVKCHPTLTARLQIEILKLQVVALPYLAVDSWLTLLPAADDALKAAPFLWHLAQRQPSFACNCGFWEQNGTVKVNKATPVSPLE